ASPAPAFETRRAATRAAWPPLPQSMWSGENVVDSCPESPPDSVGDALEMLPKQVAPEVAVEVAPHGMNMVGVVLGVVVLDQERGPLDPVIVRLEALGVARPREADLLDSGFLEASHAIGGQIGRHRAGVDLDQLHQQIALAGGQRRGRDA